MNSSRQLDATALTADAILLGSLSYRGFSSRFEMWILLLVQQAASVFLTLLHNLGLVLMLAFYLLCVCPLFVRRARQMGSAGYGVFLVVLCTLELLTGLLLYLLGQSSALEELSKWSGLTVFLLLPLFFWGGRLSGSKNALMRAAISGDTEQARQLAEQHPEALWQISQKGFRASEYADMQGHQELAAYLRDQEDSLLHIDHLPSAKDISPYDTLDEVSARKDFLGKTRQQASQLFFEHAIYYLEDLFWMGDAGFSYYLPAVIPFMESEESAEDGEFVSSLLLTIGNRLEESPQAVRACREDALHILRYLNTHWAKFDIDAENAPYYSDLPAKAARQLAAIEAMA